VTRQANAALLVPCSAPDQLPPPPWSDKVIADVIVDGRSKLDECSSRFNALAGWVKAGQSAAIAPR